MSPAPRLLGAGQPPACETVEPKQPWRFLIACDHASRRIPAALGDLGIDPAELESHIAWDIGAAAVARLLAERLGAALVLQNYSRLVIDCNRPLAAADSIAAQSAGVRIPGNENLTAAQVQARRDEIFLPYHDALRALLQGAPVPGSVLIALHSFTPVFRATARPWHCAVLYQRDPRLALALRELLCRDALLRVGENEPYALSDASDYTVPIHAEARGLIHVELEIRQDLIATAAGQEAWAGRLATLLPEALEVVLSQE